ncbi:MAG: TRIC cation channel family protein [Actinobacteria bacterium]|nr:TRIC cation channel family protein [Actinomycetota bacterium]
MSAVLTLVSAYSTASASFIATASATASTVATAGVAATHSVPATGGLESIVTSLVPSLLASALPSVITTTAPVTSAPLFLPVWFEVAAIFAGALAGGVRAVRRKFDVVGVLVLALVNGLGGGIMRDLLLQDYGIFALKNPRALVAVVVAALVAYFFLQVATRLGSSMVVIDALSLALFCIAGADKALIAGLGIPPAILLGVVTATGGGIMRDILCDTEPVVLRPGTFSATAAVAGSSVFVFMVTWLNFTKPFAMLISALVTLVLRMGSLWRGWKSREPRDLTDVVATMPRRLLSGAGRLRRTTPCDPDDPDPDDRTPCP